MPFLTEAEIKALRIRDSKVITIQSIQKEVRLIKVRAEAQNRSLELHEEIKAGKRPSTDAILFLFENGLAQLDGTPLTAEDARVIFSFLELDELTTLANTIGDNLRSHVKGKQSAEPPPELTPSEKKG